MREASRDTTTADVIASENRATASVSEGGHEQPRHGVHIFTALTAGPVALLSGRLITQIGLTIPAVLWLVTGTLAYRAARRHDYAHHQNRMTRNYALTLLAVTSRILARIPSPPAPAPSATAPHP
ncbi:putative membrane protein DUF2306 [Herbihabitans rhizosphaerae]|uniref:Putative membrane protein DUF2306 n=1 Tax=Herbihabitans rhizosphaerae TaxID=1872711 RepID=A0A4V2EUM0_9PSEU|nr:DUF2306 domain-containing protein [Herbihabitans rhizosphaerae]RZS45043.1 putative membrane protein DUF2306 [Herbihabitans rhizosphaerae]